MKCSLTVMAATNTKEVGLTNNLKYTTASCSSNHGHISFLILCLGNGCSLVSGLLIGLKLMQ